MVFQSGNEGSSSGRSIGSSSKPCPVVNPVLQTSAFAYEATNLVKIDDHGVYTAAKLIRNKLKAEAYTPRTWRTHALHICPKEPYDPLDPSTKKTLDWIFLISALNFSFWSEKEGTSQRYGVEWRTGWQTEERKVHTGYWSLVAALNRALEEGIPIIDPAFYASEVHCPDSLIAHVFRHAPGCGEAIPLIKERIAVMREVGSILNKSFGGSYEGFLQHFHRLYDGEGTALDLVKLVVEAFPSFRDECVFEGTKVHLWKRPQILVAETWAAFSPPSPTDPHPIFHGKRGPRISDLTMFADYRVPQILHHLRILSYPQCLVEKLEAGEYLPSGSREELSLRASSIVAVERVRIAILSIIGQEEHEHLATMSNTISSVLIDFFLWDLAKRIESGVENIQDIKTERLVPIHRTRSIWY